MSRTRLIPVIASLLALAACSAPAPSATPSASATPSTSASASASPSATPTSTVKASNSLDGIKVTGERLKKPSVSVKAPFAIDQTRMKVLEAGTGARALADGYVTVHYYGVNGRTGKMFEESYTENMPKTFALNGVVAGFKTGLTGQQSGSRVLIAMPGTDAYDASPSSGPEGYEAGDTLIFVVDVLSVSVAEPSGTTITPPAGLPTVSAGTGKPTITIPSTAAPTKMVAQTLIEGTENKVAKGDSILARYVGYSWKTGKLVDDGFDSPSGGALSSTIPGWQTGLVGKPVGSRVLLVLPPADGFPKGSNNPPLEAGDTIVYVVDLLFATAS
ncbi:MAG TPA: FKBP-type peptidyl-prolyl cis-trans isomerase [Propionicimonas sp.]|nr:FKBP-type peptidyl-prolyl cis-trans isomerase [Propionicimonas sp.]HQD96107.1 FKBP-type peptidyl-prolyl cis-trans isomerase [Propionicimonas sp.]